MRRAVVAASTAFLFASACAPEEPALPGGGETPGFGGSTLPPGTVPPTYRGPHGVIDESFGEFGYAYGLRGSVDGMAVAPDDSVFVGATYYNDGRGIAVVHYREPGVLDLGFGQEGLVNTTREPFLTNDASASQVLIRSNGSVLAIGRVELHDPESFQGIALLSRSANGSMDGTYGEFGRVLLRVPNEDATDSVPLDALITMDGSIAIVGFTPGRPSTPFIARVAPSGLLMDATVYDKNKHLRSLDLAPDGNLVSAGFAINETGGRNVLVIKTDPSGRYDPTFADGGVFTVDLDRDDEAVDAVVRPDGRIVITGNAVGEAGLPHSFIIQLMPDGSPDPNFAMGGILVLEGLGFFNLGPVAVDSLGRIVIAGEVRNDGHTRPILMRFGERGTFDTGFGDGGFAVFWDVEPPGYPIRLGFDSQDRILVGGATGDVVRFFLMRVLP